MKDQILTAALTFSVLIGGTVAFGSEMFAPSRAAAATQAVAVTLPQVNIVGHRQDVVANDVLTLPPVQIVGHRVAPTVTLAWRAGQASRVE